MKTATITAPRMLLAIGLTAMLALLAACTGTKEASLPTLLLVGVEEGGVPQLLLIEDVQGASVAAAERLQVVPGSRRELLAPAVAVDLTSRELDRNTAWVLTRSVATVAGALQVRAYLQSFDVAQIDPSAPSAFAEQEGKRRTLTEPGGSGDLDGAGSPNLAGTVCPTALQVSRDGSYAVILDDPAACGFPSSSIPVIWLHNTATGAAQELRPGSEVLGVRPYSDQRRRFDNEHAYFLVGAIGAAQVYTVNDFTTGRTSSLGTNEVAAEPNDIVDLGGSSELLVVLSQEGLVTTDLSSTTAPPTPKLTPTINDPRRLTVDPLGATRQLLVQSANQVAVHLDASDAEPAKVNFSAHAGTIEPRTSWAYLVGNGEMLIIDLLSRLDPGEPLRSAAQRLVELTLPTGPDGRPVSVITWLVATEPPPASP